MSKLYIYNYNNYYNRRIKRSDSLEGYGTPIATQTKANFVPGDEVRTSHVMNYNGKGDYLVVCDDEDNIVSRWFILSSDRTRGNQYKLELRRDAIVDNFNVLSNSVFNVDRCELSNENNLIFNSEGFTYNQIKKEEYKLYDRTGSPWIVGYIDNNRTAAKTGTISTAVDYDVNKNDTAYASWTYASMVNQSVTGSKTLVDTKLGITWDDFWGSGLTGCYAHQGPNSSWNENVSGTFGTSNESIRYSESDYNTVRNASNRNTWINWTVANQKLNLEVPPTITDAQITDLTALNGKRILFSDGIYLINFQELRTDTVYYSNYNNTTTQYIIEQFDSNDGVNGTIKNPYKLSQFTYTEKVYYLTTQKVGEATSVTWTIPTSANKLTDSPYTMFCMPFPDQSKRLSVENVDQDRDLILQIALDIQKETTNGEVYDLQVLPYCPVEFYSYGSYTDNYQYSKLIFTGQGWTENIDYTKVVDNENHIKSYIFFPKQSTFKFSIDFVTNPYFRRVGLNMNGWFDINYGDPLKVKSETQFIRLCDNTYSSVFEISPAKNRGISRFDIFCTYKPYNPFILVAPNFGGLYGDTYNDNRGLLCLGDYSLPNTDDAWKQYELNNKTYQQAFNREISHMETEYSIQRQEALWSMGAGTLQGAASGALTGSMVGGGAGAAVGAIAGGGASLFGGIMDYNNLVARQNEGISYRKDMFNFQLENIKATPNTLTKTTSLVANNKYVPFVECYDASTEEKNILKEYIKYNGMKAGLIGAINPSGFVRANIIKTNENIVPQELDELNTELMKGVYFE